MAFKMKNPMLAKAASKSSTPMQANYSPMKEDRRVKGDKYDDKRAADKAYMSYTKETRDEAYNQLVIDEKAKSEGKFNLAKDLDGMNVEGQINFSDLQDRIKKNADIVRAYRHQQDMLGKTGVTGVVTQDGQASQVYQ
tara:strand:- start:1150 stop:1563 length:414 start_codon:yes stop_codon:yes gene_type:complete